MNRRPSCVWVFMKKTFFFFFLKKKYGEGTDKKEAEKEYHKDPKTGNEGYQAIQSPSLHFSLAFFVSWWEQFLSEPQFFHFPKWRVAPRITQALYGTWPSVTLSVLFIFHIFTSGERTIFWFTKKQTITKVNPLLSVLKFFWATTASRDWLVYIENMPFTTSVSGWNGTGILWHPLFWIGEGHSDIGISAWGQWLNHPLKLVLGLRSKDGYWTEPKLSTGM